MKIFMNRNLLIALDLSVAIFACWAVYGDDRPNINFIYGIIIGVSPALAYLNWIGKRYDSILADMRLVISDQNKMLKNMLQSIQEKNVDEQITIKVPCPECGKAVEVELCGVLNATDEPIFLTVCKNCLASLEYHFTSKSLILLRDEVIDKLKDSPEFRMYMRAILAERDRRSSNT